MSDDPERLRAELAAARAEIAALHEGERRFRALIERSTDVLYVLDEGFHITFWSPGAALALGWSAEETVGRYGVEFVHPGDVAMMVPPDPTAPAGRDAGRFRFRLKHRSGAWREMDAEVRSFLSDPVLRGIIVNARDVTDTRLAEARAAEAEKLEQIGRLAGSVAHDFNNLLTVILSFTDFARQAIREGAAPALEDLDEVVGAAGRAQELTRALLAFARQQPMTAVTVDLNEVLRGCERRLRRLCGDGVEPTFALTPRPCLVRGDATRFEQVVLNLVVNARDAMPDGGLVELTTEFIAPAGAAPDRVRLRVRDHGVGITPEVRARLFEPFFTTKAPGQGTGLGLATAYGIVRQAGGTIEVESQAGLGSTFDVVLPLAATPRPPSQRPSGSSIG